MLPGSGCQSYTTGGKTYKTCFPAAGSDNGAVMQSWPSGFLNLGTTTVTLSRNMQWTSSGQNSAGGFYALSNGDACGNALRSGRAHVHDVRRRSLEHPDRLGARNLRVQPGAWPVRCVRRRARTPRLSFVLRPQTWYVTSACVGAVGVIKNTGSNGAYCMSAAGTTANSAIQAQPCNSAAPSQQFILQPNKAIYNPASGLCVDVKGGAYSINVPLQLQQCNNMASQQFTQPNSYPGTYGSTLGLLNSCITGGATLAAGSAVGLNGCTTLSNNLNWQFTPVA